MKYSKGVFQMKKSRGSIILIVFLLLFFLVVLSSCAGGGDGDPDVSYTKDITSFDFLLDDNGGSGLIDDVYGTVADTTVNLTVPFGTDVTALVPTIAITGVAVDPGNELAQDFTNAVTYTVTADDGTTKDYTVTVTVAPSDAKDITSFVFTAALNGALSSDVTGTVGATAVALTVPFGTDVTALVPTIAITGVAVDPGNELAQDFTNAVTYTVTADDGTTKDYTVTVTVAASDTKDITSFDFLAAENGEISSDVTGTVGDTTVTLTVPFGTDVTALNPTIVITGASVSPASLADQDFTIPVVYTVTADDGTTKDYTVTVTVAPSDAKDITSFDFLAAENGEISTDVTGTVDATTVALTVPSGTDVTALNPTIVITGVSVSPASLADQDFTIPVDYTVTADDGTTKVYTVTVVVE